MFWDVGQRGFNSKEAQKKPWCLLGSISGEGRKVYKVTVYCKITMKIYQDWGINKPEDANLPAGTIGLPFIVTSAQIIKALENRNVLQMGLRERDKTLGLTFEYSLYGAGVYRQFMEDTKVEKADSLVGRTIFAFIPPRQDEVIGLTIRE